MKSIIYIFAFVALPSLALSQSAIVSSTEAHWVGDSLFSSPYPPAFSELDSVVMPKAINRQDPPFPKAAREQQLDGDVVVNLWVDKNGKPLRASIAQTSNTVFNQPSLAAAMKWTFTPATRKGVPIDIALTIPFRFRLKTNQ